MVKAVTTIIAIGRQVDSYKYLMTVAQHKYPLNLYLLIIYNIDIYMLMEGQGNGEKLAPFAAHPYTFKLVYIIKHVSNE